MEYVAGSCPPKSKHLLIKKQCKDSSASSIVEGKLCCFVLLCAWSGVLHVKIHFDFLINNLRSIWKKIEIMACWSIIRNQFGRWPKCWWMYTNLLKKCIKCEFWFEILSKIQIQMFKVPNLLCNVWMMHHFKSLHTFPFFALHNKVWARF